ncbi:unnamed protein product [Microthlaspi erraticum]|uniref:Uncharacterized protein n=1 Tax=Microthlaspi erraticum TaxID=1685480 RepID=A0A6D2J231_9BRAS|nr:unnamed protein product [Microthlaspi erraticum]
MRIEDTSYGNSKHLGSIYNRLQALEGSSHSKYKRERGVQHPTSLPSIAMPSQEEATITKSMRTMKKKKEMMQRPSPSTEEEDTWHYDPIDPNKISPMKLKEFNAKKARFPMAPHAVNQPSSPPSTPPPEWYVNSISREKLAEFNQFVQTLPASMSFQQAWRHYPFTTFFHNCRETPQDIKELFEKAKVQPTFK